MRRFALVLLAIGLVVPSFAQDFKPYPGSKLDDKASREASAAAPGKTSQVYTTSDSLDKVYAFYKGMYKEDTKLAARAPKLPSGQVKWYFFILDGEKDTTTSKLWMKIQRPYIGGADGSDVRDLTVIQVVRTK
jgi:hypothetical protein